MLKKTVVAVAVACGLGLGLAPAGAASAAGPAASDVSAMVWSHHSYWPNYASCADYGRHLVDDLRVYRAWTCVPSSVEPGLPWDLQVLD